MIFRLKLEALNDDGGVRQSEWVEITDVEKWPLSVKEILMAEPCMWDMAWRLLLLNFFEPVTGVSEESRRILNEAADKYDPALQRLAKH